MDLIQQIMEICIIPLLAILTSFLIKTIDAKAKEIKSKTANEVNKKYIDMITSTVKTCVMATNQTYVESLKKEGKFNKEAQKIAFEKTYGAVLTILTEESKRYIEELTGDINMYLTQLIESEVNKTKKWEIV